MSYGDDSYGDAAYGGDGFDDEAPEPTVDYEVVRVAAVRSGRAGASAVRSSDDD